MKVSEIFLSIEGEGIRMGAPAVFVRLHGCNLRCSYCDSMYAVEGEDYTEMSIEEIISAVDSFGTSIDVTLTGGEPLIHKDVLDLIVALSRTHQLNIETNGAVTLSPLRSVYTNLPPIVTMDWKSKSSGMSHLMDEANLELLSSKDVLKFVVETLNDLNQMRDIILTHELECNIFVSPVFGQIDPADIVDYILTNQLNMCRVQLQLHKLIWDKDKRGV